jgi:hypothetical protein
MGNPATPHLGQSMNGLSAFAASTVSLQQQSCTRERHMYPRYKTRDCSVCIVTGYVLDGRGTRVRFQAEARDCSPQSPEGPGTHMAS